MYVCIAEYSDNFPSLKNMKMQQFFMEVTTAANIQEVLFPNLYINSVNPPTKSCYRRADCGTRSSAVCPTHVIGKSEGSQESNSLFTISKPCSSPLKSLNEPADITTDRVGQNQVDSVCETWFILVSLFISYCIIFHMNSGTPTFATPCIFLCQGLCQVKEIQKKSQDIVPSGQTLCMRAKKLYSKLSSLTAWRLTEKSACHTWCSVLL